MPDDETRVSALMMGDMISLVSISIQFDQYTNEYPDTIILKRFFLYTNVNTFIIDTYI